MHDREIYVVKADGTKELFDVTKLENSLKRAGATNKVVSDILSSVRERLVDDMSTHDIYHDAFSLLKKEEKPIALRYSLKRAIMELGPSGFPFEKYVAEIFKAMGYEALTGQIVKGFCVEHEIDVVAWNEKKLIMVEAKFHNTLGVKSDVKVALYVKARFDDLRQMTFNFGGKERELTEGWLVTNTKFTSTAIEYGSCQGGIVMIGWNYPPYGNLHDMILEAKLHPITCLVTLSGHQKKELLSQGIVLCKTLSEKPEILSSINTSKEDISIVLKEISEL
jgi:hypothetical protein